MGDRVIQARHKQCYASAGLTGIALHYAVLFLWPGSAGSPVVASTIGAIAGGVACAGVARHGIFAGSGKPPLPLLRFAVVATASIGVNAAILSLMILALPLLSAQFVATCCMLLAGYVLHDAWRFRMRTLNGPPAR